jgi:hypothetical protein
LAHTQSARPVAEWCCRNAGTAAAAAWVTDLCG